MTEILRPTFPQRQGGGLPLHRLGAQLLSWLAQATGGKKVLIDVPRPALVRLKAGSPPAPPCWRKPMPRWPACATARPNALWSLAVIAAPAKRRSAQQSEPHRRPSQA